MRFINFIFFKFLPILFLFFISLENAISYEEFDGRYKYNENSENFNIINNDEEVLFIVDFSGSMGKNLGYQSKMHLSMYALKNILKETQAQNKVGLRIFGITDKPIYTFVGGRKEYNARNICSASRLALPIARYNSDNIVDNLLNYKPTGASPIGYSLRQAVQNDFSTNAKYKHIILVTDGGENCGDDPCMYIKNLMQLRDDIKIDVIGITLDANAYSQLSCISKYGKGKFYTINDPSDFNIKFMEAYKNSNKSLSTNPVSASFKSFSLNSDSEKINYKNYLINVNE